MTTTRFIFLVGHPASGKSTLYKKVAGTLSERGISTRRINDREFFSRTIEADEKGSFHTTNADGSFTITDQRFYEMKHKLLRNNILETSLSERWVFVELTSNDYSQTAMEIGLDVLQKSLLILLLTSYELANERNNSRPHYSADIDEGRIPMYYLRQCYEQNLDIKQFSSFFKKSLVLNNESNCIDTIDNLVTNIIDFLNDSDNTQL